MIAAKLRIINYEPHLFHHPYFITLEFPERAGALRDFLQAVQTRNSICYFNYTYSGEQVGRALIGFEFDAAELRDQFRDQLAQSDNIYREVEDSVLARVL